MDRITIGGLLLALLSILGGMALEGGSLGSLIQPTALFIVLGGTLAAVMVQSPMPVFKTSMRMAKWLFVPPTIDPAQLIRQIEQWSNIARKEGLLALEAQIPSIKDPFRAKGLQLLVDGCEPERLREVLEVEISAWETSQKSAAKVWESAGGYSPTIGILGAVMGLIHVMENLSDPSKLGAGIAVAFVATIYGVGLANLLFLPMAKKLLASVSRLVIMREMLVDGLVGIANGDNPRIIESRMRGYLA
jgi:chemotaxis protein MotA